MAHATKRGKRWRCLVFSHYEYEGGQKVRRYKSFTAPTKREAERLAAQYEYDRAHTPQTITVHDAIDQYISIKRSVLSPSTVNAYERYLSSGKYASLEPLDIKAVDQVALQMWISETAAKHSPKYVRNLYALLRTSLNMFGAEQLPVTLPTVPVKDMYVPTDAQLQTFLAYLNKPNKYELRVAAMLAAFGSLRRSEICALAAADFNGNEVHVTKAMVRGDGGWVIKDMPKNNRSIRHVTLPPSIVSMIDLTHGPRILDANPDELTGRFKRAVHYAGLDESAFTLHTLRHYYVSIAHALGVPDEYIMKMGGWRTDYVMKRHYRTILTDIEEKNQQVITEHFETVMQPKCNQDAEKC